MLFLVQSAFVLFFILNMSFVKLSIGLPVKDGTLLLLFGLLFLGYSNQVLHTLSRHRGLIGVFVALGAVGVCLTILEGQGIRATLDAIPRMLVQPFLVVVCTYTLASLAGVGFVSMVFIGGALLTGAFAVLQFADISAAWDVREILSSLQREPASLASVVRARERPMGISLTPIIFSYHVAAAYITANLLYRKGMIASRPYMLLVGAFLLMSAANGTRSLLLGIMAHEALSRTVRLNLRSILVLAVLGAVALAGIGYLSSIGSRVVTVTDASAVGRWTLYEYGLQLARDNVFGYGWNFNPGDYAWLYWDQLSDMARAEAAFRLDIHNAYLNFFLLYGLYGVLIIVISGLLNPSLFLGTVYFATAYLVHAFFHNDGVFLNDDYFWFAFAIYLFVRDTEQARAGVSDDFHARQPHYPPGAPQPGLARLRA